MVKDGEEKVWKMFSFPVFTEFLCVAVFSVVVFSSYGLVFFFLEHE